MALFLAGIYTKDILFSYLFYPNSFFLLIIFKDGLFGVGIYSFYFEAYFLPLFILTKLRLI